MNRRSDWQLRFEQLVRERQGQPFRWGSNDCALFAADAVQAATGAQVHPDLRDHASAREALRVLRRAGGLQALATAALGDPVPPAFANVGDVVLVRMGKRQALGVCNGQTVLGPSRAGLMAIPISEALMAWRV